MSDDDLKKLQAALKSAPPPPDPAAKRAVIARAIEGFDQAREEILAARQESGADLRPTPEGPPKAGLLQGVKDMFDKLTTKAGLAATTGIVAAGLAAVVILPRMEEPAAPQTVSLDEAATGAGAPSPTGGDGSPAMTAQEDEETESNPPAPREAQEEGRAVAERKAVPVIVAPGADRARQADDADTAAAGTPPEDIAEALPPPAGELAAIATEGDAAAPQAETAAPRRIAPAMGADTQQKKRLRAGFCCSGPLPTDPVIALPAPDTEAFPEADANPVKVAASDSVSTFSIDVDTASYAVVRSSLNAGQMPPPEAVRAEEMVNYFPYAYAAPEPDDAAPFRPTVTLSRTPWNPDTRLMTIALQGTLPEVDDRPPLNLVFLVDSSGSMNQANKLPLLKQSLRLMLPRLRPEDEIAIVAYAGNPGLVLPPTPAAERATILAALENIGAGGSTAGAAGLRQAYAVAEQMRSDGELSRVLLATDGDFNVGLSSPEEMRRFIEQKRDSGTFLSVLGFGRGNLNDALMQALAQNGNGQAAHIDTLNEARKVLVDQLTGALFPIASDVKIQVEFNPAEVAEYRLIGYETRALRREDFNNDKVDAGEIGAGHAVTALYEITPVGSPAVLNDPLRYGSADASLAPAQAQAENPELAFLRLRWKAPGETGSTLLETPITEGAAPPDDETRFATAIAGFAQLLRGSAYIGDWSYADAIALASDARGPDRFGYRAEAINLMRLAESLSQ